MKEDIGLRAFPPFRFSCLSNYQESGNSKKLSTCNECPCTALANAIYKGKFEYTIQNFMYFDKLRFPPLYVWRALTLASIMLLVYQEGPNWIIYANSRTVTETQISHWYRMYNLLSTDPEKYEDDLAVCEIWFSVHGLSSPSGEGVKGLSQKWQDILSYLQGYKR